MRRSSLITVCFSLVLTGLAVGEDADSGALRSPLTPRHWRVIWRTNPCREAFVAWDTAVPGTDHLVAIRTKGSVAAVNISADSGKYSYLKAGQTPFFYHAAALDQLEPATTYELQFSSDGHTSGWFHFDTAPDDGRPFSLVFGGDSRTGLETRKLVNRRLAEVTEQSWQAADPSPRIYALVHGGDYVYYGTNAEQWQQWLADCELTTTTSGRLLPIIPARGNHDRGRLFCEAFGFDPQDENYYGLSFGSLLRLVTLNTEVSIAGNQAQWLSNELATARPSHRWLLVQYHRPAYPAVKAPSGALVHWVPLFEQFQVDLVCEADGHNIKRTLPIRDGTYDPTGVVYIGEGGLGVPQRTPKASRWFLRPPGMCDSGHHFQLLRFSPEELRVECRLLNGETRDVFTRRPVEQAVSP